jgi:hypothetical protein
LAVADWVVAGEGRCRGAPVVSELLFFRDINSKTDRRATPLHVASAGGLVDAGANVSAISELQPGDEATRLRVAAIRDKPEVIQLLLRAEAEVDPSGDILFEVAMVPLTILLRTRDWQEESKATVRKLVRARADLWRVESVATCM